jgi:hypothetical protein
MRKKIYFPKNIQTGLGTIQWVEQVFFPEVKVAETWQW